jgi:hypothetical protein
MNQYIENARKNLLKYSEEKTDYIKAKNEWYFTDEIIDNNDFIEIDEIRPSCELCEHEDLRWQFTIKNDLNNNELKVGSTCINQFDIVLIDNNGNKIYGKERDQNVENAINKKRSDAEYNNVLERLRELWRKDKKTKYNKYIVMCGKYWKENKKLKPIMLAFIIFRFNENGIKYNNLKLKLESTGIENQWQLERMEKWKYDLIKCFLTQKKRLKYDKILR